MQKSIDQFLKKSNESPFQSIPKVSEVEIIEIVDDNQENSEKTIICPICSINLSALTLDGRESHVEMCLLRPNENKLSLSVRNTPVRRAIGPIKPSKPSKKPKQKQIKYAPDFKYLKFKKSNVKIIVDGFNYSYPTNFIDDLEGKAFEEQEFELISVPHKVLYFLSHFHSDHYIGLSKGWCKGSIWSSIDSIKLVNLKFNLKDQSLLNPLDFDKWVDLVDYSVDNVGVRVKLYDANHCPGGAIFIFEEYTKEEGVLKRILHTGDFRVSFKHIELFKDIFIDDIYLDTTYMNSNYRFPNQRTLIKGSISFFKDLVINSKGTKNSVLNYFKKDSLNMYKILFGSYSIGKEKLFLELAKALKTKVFISKDKLKILSKISNLKESMNLLETENEKDCIIHVVNLEKLKDVQYLQKFKSYKVIKVRPTGWTYNIFQKRLQSKKRKIIEKSESSNELIVIDEETKDIEVQVESDEQKNTIKPIVEAPITLKTKEEIINSLFIENMDYKYIQRNLQAQYSLSNSLQIPYSEHSSFKELSIMGITLQYGQLIPTVSVEKSQEFQEWFTIWKTYGDWIKNDEEKLKSWIQNVCDYYKE